MKATYAKLFTDLNYQNQVLKSVVFGLLTVLLISLCSILIFSYRAPVVVGLSSDGAFAEIEGALTKRQIEAAIRHYVKLRYNWKKENLSAQSRYTEKMIADSSISPFRKTIQDLLKFTVQKSVEQRAYAKSIEVNEEKKTAFVVADRINEIENLKAATELRVLFKYTLGDRTVENPWGVYIEKESEGDVR